MKKIRIMCFGDSYTWGYVPGSNHERFPENIRFPKILQKMLGSKYEIIEEGLNSRTLISDDERPGKEGRNGSSYIIPCLDSHDPIDLVIILLGTNELKVGIDGVYLTEESHIKLAGMLYDKIKFIKFGYE